MEAGLLGEAAGGFPVMQWDRYLHRDSVIVKDLNSAAANENSNWASFTTKLPARGCFVDAATDSIVAIEVLVLKAHQETVKTVATALY